MKSKKVIIASMLIMCMALSASAKVVSYSGIFQKKVETDKTITVWCALISQAECMRVVIPDDVLYGNQRVTVYSPTGGVIEEFDAVSSSSTVETEDGVECTAVTFELP